MAVVLLALIGVVTVKTLASARRYVFLGVFVVSMVLTPPDPFSQTLLALPMYLLYEGGLLMARILAPGGVLLATVPGITKISPPEDEEWGEWWHYTRRSAFRLAEEAFGPGNVEVKTYGNVLAAAGFLYGLSASDLRPEELAATDRLYEVTIAIRAVKAPA